MMKDYKTIMLSDEPKIAGVPVTTGIPVFFLTALGVVTGLSYQLFLIGAFLSLLLHLKFGGLFMRSFLAIIYWSLPNALTSLMFRGFPNSAYRIYVR